jgi:hypothetical protein
VFLLEKAKRKGYLKSYIDTILGAIAGSLKHIYRENRWNKN